MSKVVRSVKNVTKGYSSVQVKVREATSNDAWGPTGAQMSEIAQMTFNGSNDFYEIMDMLDKRLNDKGKNWRHVLKSLKVLDYCLHEGSELVVTWARKNIYIIKTLREFQYIEDDSRDVGQNVRTSAKELTSLIMDEERLRAERADRKSWKSRVTGIDEYGPSGSGLAGYGEGSQQMRPQRRPQQDDDNDLEMRLAIEASMNEAEEEKKRRQSQSANADDDADLQKAIKLSKEEEELRRHELEKQNAQSLFDDFPAPSNQPQYTGYNQGYQQGGAVDLYGNPVYQQQQPMNTGLLDSAYSQYPTQQTGFQNGFGNQMTGMNPNQQFFQQQQQPNFLQAQQTLQPQQTAFNNLNPYQQQGNDFSQFQQQPMQQQQQQQQAISPTAGTNNPWGNNLNQMEALKPAPTGSNNPFASKFSQPQHQQTNKTTLNTLAEQQQVNQFQTRPNPIMSFTSSQPQQQQQQQPQPQPQAQSLLPQQQPRQELDPQRARLNALLASGEGMDTFGNTGDLRIPAQHTAPGTFVNSAGQNLNKLHSAQTGNNPFFSSQNTGMPQQSSMMPAATGPAGMNGGYGFGQGGNNPFGAQQGQRNQPGGSLIDL